MDERGVMWTCQILESFDQSFHMGVDKVSYTWSALRLGWDSIIQNMFP